MHVVEAYHYLGGSNLVDSSRPAFSAMSRDVLFWNTVCENSAA